MMCLTNTTPWQPAELPPLVIWGAGGHARVVKDILDRQGRHRVIGFLDDVHPDRHGTLVCGVRIQGGRELLHGLRSRGIRHAIVAIGDNHARLSAADELTRFGFELAVAVHPSATIAAGVELGPGTVVAAGAVVGPNARIGKCGIVNHLASVDHDCQLADAVHISPGARLAGGVKVGQAAWLGLNSSVLAGVKIAADTVVGAGAVVLRDIEERLVVCGVPARPIQRRTGNAAPTVNGAIQRIPAPLSAAHTAQTAKHRSAPDAPPSTPKAAPGQLAILGGKPAFEQKLYVGCPNIPNRKKLLRRIRGALRRRWLTNDGPLVREFEQKLASFLDVPYVVACCNATLGLQLCLRALKLTGEVIVPSKTFVATAHAVEWEGLKPVFCDIDPATHHIDPRRVIEQITPHTSAILAVHLWGYPCAIDELSRIAGEHGLKLLFDAAHAIGCSYRGRGIGNYGDASVFSFHATKMVNSLEGGAITTNSQQLADELRLLRNFGFAGTDHVVALGTNAKMDEFSAAMGLGSLESFPRLLKINRANHRAYRHALDGIAGLRLHADRRGADGNCQYVVVEVDPDQCPLSRDELIQVLWAENVVARRYFYPGCHRSAPYSTRAIPLHSLTHTERLCDRVMALPTGSAVTPAMIADVGQVVRLAVGAADSVRAAFSQGAADQKRWTKAA